MFHRAATDPPFLTRLPDPLYVFKNLQPTDKINIPELPKNRKITNLPFLIIFILALLTLGGLSAFVVYMYGNKRALKNEDLCGNTCGQNNVDGWRNDTCELKNYTAFPLSMHLVQGEEYIPAGCTTPEDCRKSFMEVGLGRCLSYEKLGSPRKATNIVIMFMIFDVIFKINRPTLGTIAFSLVAVILMLKAFHCNTLLALKFSLFLGFLELILFAILRWYSECYRRKDNCLYFWISHGFFTLSMILLVILFFRRIASHIKLIIALYEEATKVVFFHVFLIVLPFLSISFLFFIYGLSLYLVLLVVTALTTPEPVSSFYYYWLLIMLIWLDVFVSGCQCMVVAGVTASYFFTRNDPTAELPVSTTIKTLVQKHLGTVAAGSFVITVVKIVNAIMKSSKDSGKKSSLLQAIGVILSFCCEFLLEIAQYLTRKAYIMTAIHGQGLYKSGKRAARLLWSFLFDVILMDGLVLWAIYSLGIIIEIAAIIICVGIVWATNTMEHVVFYLPVGSYLSYIIIYHYIAVMNVAAETMFLCLCEDQLLNDGSLAHPYAMPKNFADMLMSLAEEEQKKIDEQEQARPSA